jgi:hypothetical protein
MLEATAEGSPIRWYLVDDANYAALAEGSAFYALAAAEEGRDLELADVAVPDARPVWLVGINTSVTTVTRVDLDLALESAPLD